MRTDRKYAKPCGLCLLSLGFKEAAIARKLGVPGPSMSAILHPERYEARRQKAIQSRAENPEKHREIESRRNKADRLEQRKRGYKRHRVKRLEEMKAWVSKNAEHRRAYMRKYDRKRRSEDVGFRLEKNLRRRLVLAVREKVRGGAFRDLTGCDFEFLRKWISDKWTDGMNWGNYGQFGWVVDHKRPCASFDLTDPAQRRACFHYTNLQPLWAPDNFRKSDTYDPEEKAA